MFSQALECESEGHVEDTFNRRNAKQEEMSNKTCPQPIQIKPTKPNQPKQPNQPNQTLSKLCLCRCWALFIIIIIAIKNECDYKTKTKQALFIKRDRLLRNKKTPARNTAGTNTELGSKQMFFQKGSDPTFK